MYFQKCFDSPLGKLYAVSDGTSLLGLWMEGQKYFPSSLKETPQPSDQDPVLLKTEAWLEKYFSGKKPSIDELPLNPQGSEFRQEVWKLLCDIPYGEVTTYGKLAEKIAERKGIARFSAQAVGGAVGHNPISIIIPCHRVIGANGSLTGYAGGVEKKKFLLDHEGVNLNQR